MPLLRVVTFVAFLIFSNACYADFMYELRTFDSTNAAQSAFQLGQTVTVAVRAVNTAAGGNQVTGTASGFTAQLFASTTDPDDGAFGTGLTTGPIVYNPGFTFGGAPTGTSLTSGVNYGRLGSAPAVSPLELFRFNYVANVLGTTNLSFGPAQFNVLNLTAGDFSPNSFSGASVSVSAVPEPSSIALLGAAGIGLVVYRLRRRQKASV